MLETLHTGICGIDWGCNCLIQLLLPYSGFARVPFIIQFWVVATLARCVANITNLLFQSILEPLTEWRSCLWQEPPSF